MRSDLRYRAAQAAAVVGTGVLAVACGVPLDSSPRAIPTTTESVTTDSSQTPTTSGDREGPEVSVFFIQGDRLEETRYPVEGEPGLQQALLTVLEQTPDPARSLTSAIPPDTRLLGSAVTAAGVAQIDLSEEIGEISGTRQKQAFAQLAFTALAHPDVTSVRFFINATPVSAPTDNGNVESVTAGDFDPPLNPG